MTITLEHPPLRPNRHKRAISRHTIDTVLENSLRNADPTCPSTASTDSSFTTAFSHLEGSPSRYYLCHTSTPTSPAYTRNDHLVYNIPFQQFGAQIDQVGRFYQCIPNESTVTEDVYMDVCTNGVTDQMLPQVRGQISPEPKLMGSWNDFVFSDTRTLAEVKNLLEFSRPNDSPHQPLIHVTKEIDVDLGSYTAGEILSSRAHVGNAERTRRQKKPNKDRRGKSKSEVGVSKKVKKMFQKLRLGKAGK